MMKCFNVFQLFLRNELIKASKLRHLELHALAPLHDLMNQLLVEMTDRKMIFPFVSGEKEHLPAAGENIVGMGETERKVAVDAGSIGDDVEDQDIRPRPDEIFRRIAGL